MTAAFMVFILDGLPNGKFSMVSLLSNQEESGN
jgi:hypothetical protein